MKKLPLSVLSAACILAITACSSNSKGDENYKALVESKLSQSTAKAKQEAEDKLAELRASVADLETKLADAEKAGTASAAEVEALKKQLATAKEAEAAAQTTLANTNAANTEAVKSLNDQISALTTQLDAAKKELEAANARLAEIDKAAQKAAEEKKRTENNVAQVKTAFVDNGKKEDGYANLSGVALTIKDNTFSASNISAAAENINALEVEGKVITLFTPEKLQERAIADEAESNRLSDIKDRAERRKQQALQHHPKRPESTQLEDVVIDGQVVGQQGSLPSLRNSYGWEQMRYGYYVKDGQTVLFVQGYMTPKSGTVHSPFSYADYSSSLTPNVAKNTLAGLDKKENAVYKYEGTAFYGKDNSYNALDAVAYADFSDKKLKVKLLENGVDKLIFGGKFAGDNGVIEGTHNGVVMKGAFYGYQASDIGGVFYHTTGENKGSNGVFGVSDANCSTYGCNRKLSETNTADKSIIDEIKAFTPDSDVAAVPEAQ